MQTFTEEEFKKMYGTQGLAALKSTNPPPKKGAIATAFEGGISKFKSGIQDARSATNPLTKTEAGLKQGAGLVEAAFSPLAPATQYIGKGVDKVADYVSDDPNVQKFAQSKAGAVTSRAAEDIMNTSELLGLMGGGSKIPGAGRAVTGATKDVGGAIGGAAGKSGKYIKGATRDVVPTKQRYINEQVAQALELTPGDLANFTKKTKNDVGKWMADNNLIGRNAEETTKLVEDFYKTNYEAVRAEIANNGQAYKPVQVPRYVDALTEINKKIENVPGLEKEWANVQNMLAKKEITLEDVQAVKEMLDEHFNLYKVTGDVGEGVAKEGLANIRSELKGFIESEVQKNTGANVKGLNNNVASAKSLKDAIATRSPKGLTRSNFRAGDMAALGFGSFVGGPAVGLALLFVKKASQTPTVRLRLARMVDQWSDAQKAKAAAELQAGQIPVEFKEIINIKYKGKPVP